jgi:hypothetical protein
MSAEEESSTSSGKGYFDELAGELLSEVMHITPISSFLVNPSNKLNLLTIAYCIRAQFKLKRRGSKNTDLG